jgi:hypothetical protein
MYTPDVEPALPPLLELPPESEPEKFRTVPPATPVNPLEPDSTLESELLLPQATAAHESDRATQLSDHAELFARKARRHDRFDA